MTIGHVPGHGLPDWPEDAKTFNERKFYQQGVADGRRLALEDAKWIVRENHLVSGGNGPNFSAGWASALDACADAIAILERD